MRLIWILIATLFLFSTAFAQTVELRGVVSDNHGTPIPFVSVWADSVYQGTVTNERGLYRLNLNAGTYKISFRSTGYKSLFRTIRIENTGVDSDIQLLPGNDTAGFNNGADSIISEVIRHQNGDGNGAWSGSLYTRESQRINKVPHNFLKDVVAYSMSMSLENKGIINFSESLADFQIQQKNYISQQVTAATAVTNSRGIFNFNHVPVLRIDFYKNTILLRGFSERAFISPLSRRAFSYYRYQLAGRFMDHGKVIDVIQVQPIRPDEHLFHGIIEVVEQQWQLYSVQLQASKDARIDFIDSVVIRQQYVPVNDNNWMPQSLVFSFYGSFWGFKYSGLFAQVYRDIHTDTAKSNIYQEMFRNTTRDYQKDRQFWEQNRAILLTPEEGRFWQKEGYIVDSANNKVSADSFRKEKNRFRPLPYIFFGYSWKNYSKGSSISLPGPYNILFYNTIEGWGADLKLRYTKVYDPLQSLNIVPEARYGFGDRVFNANLYANYVYNSYRHGSVYGRIGTDFLDLNNTGTISQFLNSLSTLYFGGNYIKLYQSRFAMAGTTGEIISGMLLTGQAEYADRSPLFNTTRYTFNKDSALLTSNNPLDPNSSKPLFPRYRALTLRGTATFTFNHEYMITPQGKFILPTQYPVVRLNFAAGIPAVGSSVNYQFLSVDVFQQRLNTGIYGYTAFYFSAGKFLNAKNLYYPDFKQFHGDQSFFFDASLGGFHFLNFYTYSTNKAYLEMHAEHNFTGILLDRVPLVGKLGLQEIIGASYLTQGTLPYYKEIYIGLKRSVVRLDYGFAFGRFTKLVQGLRLTYNISWQVVN